ncbi:MAG: phosphoglycerate dehydrogenase [Chloroflexi bacterium]|jgi:D-3-phosphoglycerate dehydrogenase / 2-oxoglutarate reductase|nr:phosphoglycerate dehydrogenase [Chloroflexota bacterium]MBT7080671.1 phosphoglycerate dehydrogenase [Chloroflexota bacterium]MBT7290248.1 phosphoglycerate dehydrogenase [Chloroflexota bacterium]
MKVLVADKIADEGLEILKSFAEVDLKVGLDKQQLIDIMGDYDALVIRSQPKVTADIIEAGTKLQIIGRAGVGVDNIDLEAATRRGIVVVNAPAGNTISTAEHTLALMMSVARNIPQACAVLKGGQWKRAEYTGTEITGKTLGIVGMGRVGSEVARRAIGLEMKVLVHDPFVSKDYVQNIGAKLVPLDDLLKDSDFITIHTTLTDATRGLIGSEQLATLKPSAYIINVARGGIIDEQALHDAVEQGVIAGAAIDVYTSEPATDNVLVKCDNIITTPHLGASTNEAQVGVAVTVAEQVNAVLKGMPAKFAVNAPIIPAETLSVLMPFIDVASKVGEVVTQLAEGQLEKVVINYNGDIANYDTATLKASVIKSLVDPVSEEHVNLINANVIAQSRGLKVVEQKEVNIENYVNMITVELTTDAGTTKVGGTLMRGETHIVLINDYWVDVVATGGYWMFSDHLDRPGLIGTVASTIGAVDVNISSMQVGRLKPRGQALMILGLDELLPEEQRQKLLTIPDVYNAKQVKL